MREPEPVRPTSEKHVAAACQHLDPHLAGMVWLQFHTGMRPGEVVQMRTCDVDRSGDVWRYRPPAHKTEAHNVSPLMNSRGAGDGSRSSWRRRRSTNYRD